MTQAKNALDDLSQDPEARRLALERADAIKLYKIELGMARKEGREEGREAERRAILLKQLATKFGELSTAQAQKVAAADQDALERYLERVLVADSIGAVLGT